MSAPRIGLVHALYASIAAIEAAFAELWPEAETISLYDQSLYAEFDRTGRVSPTIERRVETLLNLSAESGAAGILFTGSLFGDAVEAARARIDVPVLTSYEAMIEAAFARGPRHVVLATVPGTIDAMRRDVERHAREHGREHVLETHLVDGAMEALLAGDAQGHDARIAEAADRLADCDALLLAQFSMAPAARRIADVPGRGVLTPTATAVDKLRRLVD